MPYQLSTQAVPEVTVVTNEFIDKYMTGANGEYVKVYLYLLRHQKELVEVGAIADALNHTEADVRRALAYWEKAGILSKEGQAGTGFLLASNPVSVSVPVPSPIRTEETGSGRKFEPAER